MTEVDYEAIEAAVTETVRGRWFLGEFARRNRGAEVKLMLDAMGRLEAMVSAQGQAALPPPPSSDPSIRLMLQRIKEIAGGLNTVARDMREAGLAARHWAPVEQQARAVAGLMRAGVLPEAKTASANPDIGSQAPETSARDQIAPPPGSADPRLPIFSALEKLPLAQKISFFS